MKKSKGISLFILLIAVMALVAILNGCVDMGKETLNPAKTNEVDKEKTVKIAKPLNVKGVWITYDDMAAGAAFLSTNVIDNGFNTVCINFDETVSSKTDEVASFIKKIKDTQLFTVLFIQNNEGEPNGEALSVDIEKISKLNVDLLFFAVNDKNEQNIFESIQRIKKADSKVLIGLDASSDGVNFSEDIFSLESVNYIFCAPLGMGETNQKAYQKKADSAASFVSSNEKEFVGSVCFKEYFSQGKSGRAEDVINELKHLAAIESCTGYIADFYELLSAEAELNTEYLKVFNFLKGFDIKNEQVAFAVTNHQGSNITSNESTVTFTGRSDPSLTLKCNGKEVERVEDGHFSLSIDLNPGDNSIVFTHGEETYPYKVTYKIQLIKSVLPTGSLNAPGGTEIALSAIAIQGASVSASISGKTIVLRENKGQEGSEEAGDSDFVTYIGTYTLPQEKTRVQVLGKIVFSATYNSLTKKTNGAQLSVNAKISEPTVSPSTTEKESESGSSTVPGTSPSGEKPTPYKYNGISGKSKMCEVTADYAETFVTSPLSQFGAPMRTPLLKGTFEYISGESSLIDDSGKKQEYYHLSSNRRINKNDAKLISSGYNMPLNSIKTVSCKRESKRTIFELSSLWKSAFGSEVTGQNYVINKAEQLYDVKSFTATGIDFTFFSTGSASGSFDVSKSSLIKSAKWVSGSGNTMILRITFEKSGIYYGYSVSYNSKGNLVIAIKEREAGANASNSLKGYKILLDPGHGGVDSGAICSISSVSAFKYEKQINLSMAKMLRDMLIEKGATVITTRSTDVNLSLDDRRNKTRSENPDLFIGMHCNSSTSSTPMGVQSFYFTPQSFPLVSSIQKRLVSVYKTDFYKNESSSVLNKVDRSSTFAHFKVTRVEECPSILIEYGFVSNLKECAVLQKTANQRKLAEATFNGIVDYLKSH